MLYRIALVILAALPLSCRTFFHRAPAEEDVRVITVGDQVRRYILHVPASYTGNDAVPLVVVLHGGGGNGRAAAKMSMFSEKADREGFLVLYPFGSGRFAESLLTWNSGNCCGYALEHKIDDVAFIRALVEQIKSQYRIDSARVYVTGMSNGGMMTHRLACEMSDVFSGAADVSGAMNVAQCNPVKPVAMVIFHGKKDEHVLFDGGVPKRQVDSHPRVDRPVSYAVDFWRNRNGCTPSPSESHDNVIVSDFTCTSGGLALYAIEGEGHTWPGGQKGYFGADEPTQEISATDVMWDFWQKNHRP